jgi:hypothetical protein
MERSRVGIGCGTCSEEPTHKTDNRRCAKVQECLATADIDLIPTTFDHFVRELAESIRKRRTVTRRWSKDRLDKGDIAYHIQTARDGGDLDEACWRAFLILRLRACSRDMRRRWRLDRQCGRLASEQSD